MEEIIVLKYKDYEYEKNDYVAKKIKEMFRVKELALDIYANEEWSFYKYTLYSTIEKNMPFLYMEGMCLVRNSTHECAFETRVIEKSGLESTYQALIDDCKLIKFKTVKEKPEPLKLTMPKF